MREAKFQFTSALFTEISCETVGAECESSRNHLLSTFVENFVFVYVCEGKLELFGGGDGVLLDNGARLLVYPNTPLSFTPLSTRFCYYYIRFGGDTLKTKLRQRGCIRPICDTKDLSHEFGEIFRCESVKAKEAKALSIVLNAVSYAIPENGPESAALYNSPYIDSFIAFIESNYNKCDLKIGDICEQMKITVPYFTNLFHENTGMSPRKYLIKLRIDKAKNMLKNSSLNVTEIARYVGYDDALHFSSEFKKNIGVSPSQYRKLLN